MCDALGIINFEDACVDITGLMDYRPASAISFLGRYRLIDFMLSNMTNSGISQIEVFIKDKPRSLIEHLGNGRQYNINSKRGRLSILYGENRIMSEVYNHDIANFMDNIQYIEEVNKPYVIIAPSYMIYQIDFNEVLKYHAEKEFRRHRHLQSRRTTRRKNSSAATRCRWTRTSGSSTFEKEPRQIQRPATYRWKRMS